jgi:peptide/nickel transport system substrate-binding protein
VKKEGRRAKTRSGAGATAFAAGMAPGLVRTEQTRKLVFVPTSDLTVLDPIVTFNRPTRNYAYLVFDTLYGIDPK